MSTQLLRVVSSYSDLKHIIDKKTFIDNVISGVDKTLLVFCGRIISDSSSDALKLINLINEVKITLEDKFIILIDEISLYFFTSLYSIQLDVYDIFPLEKNEYEFVNVMSEIFKHPYYPTSFDIDELENCYSIISFLFNIKTKYNKFYNVFFSWKEELVTLFSNRDLLLQNEDYKYAREFVEKLNYDNLEKETDIMFSLMYIFNHTLNLYYLMTFIFSNSQVYYSENNCLIINLLMYKEENINQLSILYEDLKSNVINGVFLPTYSLFELDTFLFSLQSKKQTNTLIPDIKELSLTKKLVIFCGDSVLDVPLSIKYNDCTLINCSKKECYFSKRDLKQFVKKSEIIEGYYNPRCTIFVNVNDFIIEGITSIGKKYKISNAGEVFSSVKSLKYENGQYKTGKYWILFLKHGYYNLNNNKVLFKQDISSLNANKTQINDMLLSKILFP